MIPKIIHYCWFGGNPKPKLAKKCIKSWKKYCKGYEIKEWNEDNFDLSAAPLYVRQAYDAKKWAFVTDYVRLWALINFGGIYMDTDVEVIKPFDKFLENEAFGGFESVATIATCIMACEKNFSLFKELLLEYNNIPFILDDGSLDITTNVTRITNCCEKYGFKPNGEYQVVYGFVLYPQDYFCPINAVSGELNKTQNTYTIHHFMGSWLSSEEIERIKKWRADEKKYNRNLQIDKIIHFPNRIAKRIFGESFYSKVKTIIKK